MIIRERVENGFEAWGHLLFRHRWAVVISSLLVALTLASGVRRLETEVSFEAFLSERDPVRVAYDRFREQFGREDVVIVLVEAPDVFDFGFLERLRTLHEEIEERVPYVSEVTSLINARDTRGQEESLLVQEFLEDLPSDPVQLAALRRRALANPLYLNNMISRNGRFTNLVVELQTYAPDASAQQALGGFDDEGVAADQEPVYLSGDETSEFATALVEVVDSYDTPGFRTHNAGQAVMLQIIARSMLQDMQRFVGLAVLTIAVVLFLLFRRPSAVVISLLVVICALTSTMGLMGHTGVPIYPPTQILPSLLLSIGIGDSVHILSIYFQRLRAGRSREDALADALRHSGLPVVLTSLTTAGGFASFAVIKVWPVAMLGFFAPAGVLLALLYSVTLLPALLAVWPTRAVEVRAEATGLGGLDLLLSRLGEVAANAPWTVVGVSAALCLVAALRLPELGFSHNPLNWVQEQTPIRVATEAVNREMGGAMGVEFLIDTGRENGLHEPEVLEAMAALGEELESTPHAGLRAGLTVSLADVVKEIHRALNEDRPEFYVIPDDRRLVAQELLLFENSGSDDLEKMVDSQFREARISARVPWRDAIDFVPFVDEIELLARERLGDVAEVTLSGNLPLLTRTISAMIRGMFRSYGLALLIIAPLMMLLLGSFRLGVIAMIPNLVPILLMLGLIAWLGKPIDIFALMAGGIAIGLAVDDTIHFMHGFRRNFERGLEAPEAVRETLLTSGRAILITTLVLVTGFLIFTFSSMPNMVAFGLLLAFAITAALLADLLLAPALMCLVSRRPGAQRGITRGSTTGS